MQCPNCHSSLQGEFKFCPHCGTQIAQKSSCSACGQPAEPSWVSCPHCGNQLRSGATEQRMHQPLHGRYHGSSSSGGKHRKRRGFLGGIFSS
ncbi:MAG: zinc ribbon domain-containing protein [Peptococcaceae bacterium]|nr:zinc ribbon domain-containing protein [Peptococcaceae bacterium]